RARGGDGGPAGRAREPRPLDAALPHRRAPGSGNARGVHGELNRGYGDSERWAHTRLAPGADPLNIEDMARAKKVPDYRRLSIAERLQLVEDIWDSIAEETGTVPIPPEVLDEAERRL